jgi:hypothetical protein
VGYNSTPRYVQIKGVRFALPAPVQIDANQLFDMRLHNGLETERQAAPEDPNAPLAAGTDIRVSNDIRPVNTTYNRLISMQHQDRKLVSGRQMFERGRAGGASEARISGVYAQEGTQIVQVNVSRSSSASINREPARSTAGDDAAPVLVDSEGRRYYAKGYIVEMPDGIEISLTPDNLIRAVGELPHLPTSDTNKMRLFFEVTDGVKITSFRLGDVTVVRCDLDV